MLGNFYPCLSLMWARLGDSPLEHPNKNGAVRLGIKRKTLASWRGTTQTNVNLNELERGEAAAILHIWFWRAVSADELALGLDYAVFCHAVDDGPREAITTLQALLGDRKPSGEMSGALVLAASNQDVDKLIRSLSDLRCRGGAPQESVLAVQSAAQAMALRGAA